MKIPHAASYSTHKTTSVPFRPAKGVSSRRTWRMECNRPAVAQQQVANPAERWTAADTAILCLSILAGCVLAFLIWHFPIPTLSILAILLGAIAAVMAYRA